jgi:hypothetical protein
MHQLNIKFHNLLIDLQQHLGRKTVLTAEISSICTYDPITIICYLINLNL